MISLYLQSERTFDPITTSSQHLPGQTSYAYSIRFRMQLERVFWAGSIWRATHAQRGARSVGPQGCLIGHGYYRRKAKDEQRVKLGPLKYMRKSLVIQHSENMSILYKIRGCYYHAKILRDVVSDTEQE